MSVALARGDRRGLDGLIALTRSQSPFLRMEADGRLRAIAGKASPTWDPLSGPDDEGAWAAWLAATPGVPEAAKSVEMP